MNQFCAIIWLKERDRRIEDPDEPKWATAEGSTVEEAAHNAYVMGRKKEMEGEGHDFSVEDLYPLKIVCRGTVHLIFEDRDFAQTPIGVVSMIPIPFSALVEKKVYEPLPNLVKKNGQFRGWKR
jgi:hypothetical protein